MLNLVFFHAIPDPTESDLIQMKSHIKCRRGHSHAAIKKLTAGISSHK